MNDRKARKRQKLAKRIKANANQKKLNENQIEKRVLELGQAMKEAKSNESAYMQALLRPADFSGCKIPQPLPVATSTSRARFTGSVKANDQGVLKLVLVPWRLSGVLTVSNTVGATADADGSGVSDIAAPITSTNSSAYRVVSAELKVWCIEPSTTASGLMSIGSMPNVPAGGGVASTVRDVQGTVVGGPTMVFKAIYRPVDPSAFHMIASTNTDARVACCACPIFVASDCTANQKFAYSVVVNYEFIPASGSLDLLASTPGWVGSIESIGQKILNVGAGAAAWIPSLTGATGALAAGGFVGRMIPRARALLGPVKQLMI